MDFTLIILVIALFILSAIFFIVHLYYYKLSDKENKVVEWRWLYGGWIVLAKVFFPISIKFKDEHPIIKVKKKSNNFLFAFYICFIIASILSLFISEHNFN